MSLARVLAIASASCMLANALAAMKELEVLTLPKYPGMTAVLDFGGLRRYCICRGKGLSEKQSGGW
ncbi:hypothetical protein D3C76_1041170 [compost metagenome]